MFSIENPSLLIITLPQLIDGISIFCRDEWSILCNGNISDHFSSWNGIPLLWVLFPKLKVNPRWICNHNRSTVLSALLDIRLELNMAYGNNFINVQIRYFCKILLTIVEILRVFFNYELTWYSNLSCVFFFSFLIKIVHVLQVVFLQINLCRLDRVCKIKFLSLRIINSFIFTKSVSLIYYLLCQNVWKILPLNTFILCSRWT